MMSFARKAQSFPDALRDAVERAECVDAALMAAALDIACARCAAPYCADRASRIRQLIGSQAWTDAALALVELDRTSAVRRIVFEDGEWCCTLGAQWTVPEWLDETVAFNHPVLPLAILGAFLAAVRQRPSVSPATRLVPRSRSDLNDTVGAVSCDNFV
jgi:hypothetical protein